jgi:hypothetical protein
MFDIERNELPGRCWSGLTSFLSASSHGAPLAKHPGVGQKTADWLLAEGLLETVDNPRYKHLGPSYRVSALGHRVIKRGQHPRSLRQRLEALES